MPVHAEPSRLRRIAAAGALLTTACAVGWQGVQVYDGHVHFENVVVGGAAGLALGAALMLRRGVVGHVLARATAWIIALPATLVALDMAYDGLLPDASTAALAAASVAALLLARPMLHTPSARAEFAPARFRKWFLAGATASAAIGMAFIGLTLAVELPSVAAGVAVVVPSLLLVVAAIGVLRMRAWGVVLGVLASALTVAGVAVLGGTDAAGLLIAALPGALLALPVLVARLSPARATEAPRVRVASEASATSAVRVAAEEDVLCAREPDADEPARAHCV